MADATGKSALELIADLLQAHGVQFVVIGGQAEALYGSPRVTYDIDLCYQRTKENLQRLASALKELKPQLRNAPPDLPFQIDARSLALGSTFTLRTRLGDLDLLGYLEPLGGFDAIATHAVTMHVGDLELKVIHLDDLIAIKEYIRRPKDQQSLHQLKAIKRLQDEGQ